MLKISLWFIAIGVLGSLCVHGEDGIKSTSDVIQDGPRHLQTTQTFNYRATYKADFQHLRDFQCIIDPPELQVTCYGTAMTILNVSDPSIVCTPMAEPNFKNGTSFQCVNTCDDCTSIYQNSENAGDDPYGSIEFMCEGDDYRQVDADYIFVSGNDGTCSSRTEPQTRSYHVARFGVSCPAGYSREYVYDDTYSECFISGLGVSGFPLDLEEVNEDDVYFCLTGTNCEGTTCDVAFDTLHIRATLPSFFATCVESLVTITAVPSVTPPVAATGLEYTVQFEAAWGQLYYSEISRASCESANPTMMVTCGNGASITYVNSTDSLMICNDLSSSQLLCTGNVAAIKDNFTRVIYICVGPNIPVSQVTYPDSTASCFGNTADATLSHAVTLGILCGMPSSPEYVYADSKLECTEPGHDFVQLVGEYGFDIARYACLESSVFESGSTTGQYIRNVTIRTDERYKEDPSECFTLKTAPSSPAAPVTPVTNSPTSSPTKFESLNPSNLPTISPTIYPSSVPRKIIVTEPPTTKPTTSVIATTPIGSREVNNSSSSPPIIGIVIGCLGAGFATAALVGMIIIFRKRGPTEDNGTKSNKVSKFPNQNVESNTDGDFTSSMPPTSGTSGNSLSSTHVIPSPFTQQPLRTPIAETSSSNNLHVEDVVVDTNKPDRSIYMTPGVPFRSSDAMHPATSSSHRRSYPTNHVVNVKDQCRSVAMVRSSSPTFISPAESNIPFAVAMGVSTVSATGSNSSKNKKEPSGRHSSMYEA